MLSIFFLFFTMFVSLFSLLYSIVSTLFWSCLQFCVLVGFVFNWSIFLVSFAHQVTLTFCLLWIVLVLLVCMYVCLCWGAGMFLWFCFYLSDFAFTICLGYIFYFLVFCFFFVCFNSYYCHSRKNEEAVTKSWTQLSNNKLS